MIKLVQKPEGKEKEFISYNLAWTHLYKKVLSSWMEQLGEKTLRELADMTQMEVIMLDERGTEKDFQERAI